MLVIGPVRSLEQAGLSKDRIIHPIIRKTFALGKSLGPILYLVSVSVIATWVIGVFFGVGFFFLLHHRSSKEAFQLDVGSANLSARLVDSPWVYQTMTRLDRLFPQPPEAALGGRDQSVAVPDRKSAADSDRQAVARAEPATLQSAAEIESYAPSGDLGTTPRVPGELSQVSLPASQPSDAIGPAQSQPLASPHKPHQARPTSTRTQSHPPVQAIQELLQKHSQLLK